MKFGVPRLRQRRWLGVDEHGFTLTEILAAMVIFAMLVAIATSTWFRVIESRRVDSSTNQIVADLRLAHVTASNRLADWQVELDSGTGNYRIGPSDGPLSPRSLEAGTEFPPTMMVDTVVFNSNGAAQIIGAGNITVAADDGAPAHVIEVNTTTSRITIDP